jgi:IS5 family transposase
MSGTIGRSSARTRRQGRSYTRATGISPAMPGSSKLMPMPALTISMTPTANLARSGTGSSNPPSSTSESDANLLPRVWSCLVRSDEATQAVSPHSRAEVIRKGKAGKPTEFGKMVKLQEAENQIVVAYEVYDQRPSDSDLLIAAIETHQATLGCTPHLVAADAGFYSAKNEAVAKAKGVKRVCIPNRSTKSPERKREQKKRWFRNGQKWRTGCEGRISVVKRRHGLDRSRYRGDAGMQRWVGLGVIADNLVNISRVMAKQPGL